jgi:fumarylacetoacetase
MSTLDDTHDPAIRSWVESANDPGTDFPLQNLPFGRFKMRNEDETIGPQRRRKSDGPWRIGVAIGDQVLDCRLALEGCPWSNEAAELLSLLSAGDLNTVMGFGSAARVTLRRALHTALREGSDQGPFLELCLVPQTDAEMSLPCAIGDYTDFFTGIHHATAVGKLLRPDAPLLANYKWVPIGYHGRVSSIGVSGAPVQRPLGQFKVSDSERPYFGPSRRLDYELELGVFVGMGNELGKPKTMAQAEADWFGIVLLNDWSARDVQAWEYQPLGPFLAKSFATTISPWVVTQEALAPFRRAFNRPAGDPQPLPYLDSAANRAAGSIHISLEVWLQSAAMRQRGEAPQRLMQSNFSDAYWTVAQMLAHHSINGCNLRPGDLLGTGTQSGPGELQGGSLLELTAGGKRPLTLPGGETRTFLQDGDRVILRAFCEAPGARRIGLGACEGTVLPAAPLAPTAPRRAGGAPS